MPATESPRCARVERITRETSVGLELVVDGSGTVQLRTGLPFFEHMLEQLARHGGMDLTIEATGDLHIDAHHLVEDVGIVLGQALRQALGDKAGVVRYGHAYVPLDEALSRVVIDLSGRPGLVYRVPFRRARVGDFDVDLFEEFFRALANHAACTMHIDNLRGRNAHHQAETVFKAFGRALAQAMARPGAVSSWGGGIPSTKGVL